MNACVSEEVLTWQVTLLQIKQIFNITVIVIELVDSFTLWLATIKEQIFC